MPRTFALPLPLLAAGILAFMVGTAGVALAAPLADDPAPPTWSVEPSDAAGGDAREAFAYAIDAGTQIRDYVAISNYGADTTTFDLYATDATNDFETGAFGLLPAAEEPTDLGTWITLDVDSIELAPGARAVVPFTVLVPSDATPGDHTAGIIASVQTESENQEGQAIILDQRVGARVYLRISGDVVPAVETTGLASGFSPSWNPFGPGVGTVEYAVSNTGNVRVDVQHEVVIRGPFGIELASFEGERIVNLLPGQAQRISIARDGIPPIMLLWYTVELTPEAPTDRVAQSAEQDAAGAPVEPRAEAEYVAVSAETLTGAVSWTLLALVVVVVLAIWLGARYVSITRERMFEAIDAAEARAQAEHDAAAAAEREPVRETVP